MFISEKENGSSKEVFLTISKKLYRININKLNFYTIYKFFNYKIILIHSVINSVCLLYLKLGGG